MIGAFSASAINIKSGDKYRIVCDQYSSGTVCLGSYHSSSYPLYHTDYYDESDYSFSDAYWVFTEQNDGSYSIRNAYTGQYIMWSKATSSGGSRPGGNTMPNKGLTTTVSDEGDACHWHFDEVGDGSFRVFTKYSGVSNDYYYWNQRVDGTYALGTYREENGSNTHFRIYNELGEDIGKDNGGGGGGGSTGGGETGGGTETPAYTVIDGGTSAYVIQQTDNRLTVIPKDYVISYSHYENTINFDLINGQRHTFDQVVTGNLDVFPADSDIPSFTSYKFNNKFNYQVVVDAEAVDPTADAFTLPVCGIGKWLTASFQFSHPEAVAYIGETLQESKVTRQRFDQPMTYTVGYKTWQKMELRDYPIAGTETHDIRVAYVPYGRQQTVTVDWLTDHATGDYGVPRIDITLTDHPYAVWGNSYAWGGDGKEYFWLGQNGKSTYENASIEIDGANVFPDMEATPILIKGRGNSSWRSESMSKNPYHFKFETKQKPLGLAKGKHWVLLANKQVGSMTTNAIGHRVAEMMGGVAPCHIIPVELYINGSYRGSYNLCEKVGFSNNSIGLDDETYAAMLELDSYTDETIYYDNYYHLFTKIKEPDFEEVDEFYNLTYTGPLDAKGDVLGDWNDLMSRVYMGDDFTPYVDTERLTAYLCANELIAQRELKHCKSVFAYSENVTDGFNVETGCDDTPWVFGPVWDCDWAFGYETSSAYFKVNQTDNYYKELISGGDSGGRASSMWNSLRNNRTIDELYYRKWYDFVNNKLPELLDFCDEYYAFAQKSFTHNQKAEGTDNNGRYDTTNYATTTANSKLWLKQRAEYVLRTLTPYNIPTVEPGPDPTYTDPSALPTGNLFGNEPPQEKPATIKTVADKVEAAKTDTKVTKRDIEDAAQKVLNQ